MVNLKISLIFTIIDVKHVQRNSKIHCNAPCFRSGSSVPDDIVYHRPQQQSNIALWHCNNAQVSLTCIRAIASGFQVRLDRNILPGRSPRPVFTTIIWITLLAKGAVKPTCAWSWHALFRPRNPRKPLWITQHAFAKCLTFFRTMNARQWLWMAVAACASEHLLNSASLQWRFKTTSRRPKSLKENTLTGRKACRERHARYISVWIHSTCRETICALRWWKVQCWRVTSYDKFRGIIIPYF